MMFRMRPPAIAFGAVVFLLAVALNACGSNPGTNAGTTNPGANPGSGVNLPEPEIGAEAGPNLPITPPAPVTSSGGLWSNTQTWGGSVPKDGAMVVIPAGKTVRLDTNTAFLSGLKIQGSLLFNDGKDLKLASRFVLIDGGLLQIGTDVVPHKNKAIITLTGTDESINVIGEGTMKLGTKFLGTYMGNSRLELHGARRDALSWTKLSANLAAGATSLSVLDDPRTWRVGDEIVIASSSFEPTEAERVKITAVSGKTVSFSPALKFAHWGTLQTFDGKTVDERAEVGLLSRDIVVQGANDSAPGKFGGHAMIMGAVARVEGVEFRNMGQAGFKGRYSFHWHFAGDRPNDYFKNNSVHDSFQRAVVVHQTNKVLVENNVAYNVFNHMFVPAEDGNEQGNRFVRNLGVLVKSPPEEDFAFRVDSSLFGNSTQGEFRSSVFWAKNFGNTYRGNHAAGAQNGNGFFFDSFNSLTQPDQNEPLIFDGNVAHSIQRLGARGLLAETYPEMTFGHGVMFGGEGMRNVERKVTNSSVYKSFGGFWAEDRALTLEGVVAADNGAGVFVLRSVLNGVTVVSQTANRLGTRPFAGDTAARGAIVLPPAHGGTRAPVILDATVINESDTAINYNRHEVGSGARIERLKLINTARPLRLYSEPNYEHYYTEDFLPDPNGQVLGDGIGKQWVHLRSNLLDANCKWYAAFNAAACPGNQGFKLSLPDVGRESARPNVLIQTNGRTQQFSDPLADTSSVTVKNGSRYGIAWTNGAPSAVKLNLENSNGQVVELAFPANGAASSITQNGTGVASVGSLAALSGAAGSATFFDATSSRLIVRLRGGAGSQMVQVNAPFVNALPARAATAASAQPGLRKSLRSGTWTAPFTDLTGNPITAQSVKTGLDLSGLQPGGAMVLEGFLNVPQTGVYAFAASANGNTNLEWHLNGERLLSVQNGFNYVNFELQEVGAATLEAGLHPIRLSLTRTSSAQGAPALQLYWKRTDGTLGPLTEGASQVVWNEVP
jgi:G8 domain